MTARTLHVGALQDALSRAGLLVSTRGSLPHEVTGVTDDSRAVDAGHLFIAVRGVAADGHRFLAVAETRGAALAIVEEVTETGLPLLVVRDGRRAAAIAAACFFGWPAQQVQLLAVTGTNGKTTTVGMLRHLFDAADAPAASIGTLGVLQGSVGDPVPGGSGLTTPGPVELQRLLRELVDRGVRTVAMETSSHALHQHRLDGVAFRAALFTNLTRDHLDYHGTMEAYREAKLRLASYVAADGALVINADDEAWAALILDARTSSFGLAAGATLRAEALRFTPVGSHFDLVGAEGRAPVSLPLIGDFNVANALGAAAVALRMGIPLAVVASRLSALPQIPGRLERLSASPVVLRDYAHTPDALERALQAVRPFTARRLIAVFGCGGDRDRGKRPVMGAIAERLSDLPILTSDNPRTEDPEQILDDIEVGMSRGIHRRIADRHAAIAAALAEAADGDVVLLAGKGHETYQIRGTTSYPFDEQAIVRELLGIEAS